MGHRIIKDESWGVVDLDTKAGRIFVQEPWQYAWSAAVGAAAWTLQESGTFTAPSGVRPHPARQGNESSSPASMISRDSGGVRQAALVRFGRYRIGSTPLT
jgi:hypothetical protein